MPVLAAEASHCRRSGSGMVERSPLSDIDPHSYAVPRRIGWRVRCRTAAHLICISLNGPVRHESPWKRSPVKSRLFWGMGKNEPLRVRRREVIDRSGSPAKNGTTGMSTRFTVPGRGGCISPWGPASPLLVGAFTIADDAPAVTPRLGFLGGAQRVKELGARAETESQALVRVDLDWRRVERTPGVYDWSEDDRTVLRLTEAGRTIVLVIGGANPLYLPEGGSALTGSRRVLDRMGRLRASRGAAFRRPGQFLSGR